MAVFYLLIGAESFPCDTLREHIYEMEHTLHIPDTGLLHLVPWRDELVESLGYDIRGSYVERFWLPILGPTATWILRRSADVFDAFPHGTTVDLADMAATLGLSFAAGKNSPFVRSLQRCVMFGFAQPTHAHADGLAVRRVAPPLPQRFVQRLPPSLAVAFGELETDPTARAVPSRHAVHSQPRNI